MIFRRATRRLTATYTVVQLSLFAIFALAIWFFVTGRFDLDVVTRGDDVIDPEVILLRNSLIIFYACLLVVIPVSSWLMARAALRPVKESFEKQAAFVDSASHEMRTPLSVIQGELELALARPRTVVEYREAIESSLEATVDLNRLSDDLLSLSSASQSEITSNFAATDSESIVVEAISTTASAASIAGVQVALERAEKVPLVGSFELLVRAVANLIDNAVKFSPAGSVVSVSVARHSASVQVEVRDRGVGMTLEEGTHALERFWRADTARSTPGHGLGLALVAQIISAHGGAVRIDSTPAVGTTVTLRLPTAGS